MSVHTSTDFGEKSSAEACSGKGMKKRNLMMNMMTRNRV